jgi:CRP-like cAMP-binding protein
MPNLRQFLNSISIVNDNAWLEVEQLFAAATLKKGEYFVRRGQISTRFAFLKSGVVRAFYASDNGKEYNKQFFTPSSIIGGYSSLITGQPSVTIQQALTDCDVLIADYHKLTALYEYHADLERLGRRFAELYFVEKEQKEIEIVLYDAQKRYNLFKIRYPQLDQLIPQYHIASYLGITPTQLSRIRKQ